MAQGQSRCESSDNAFSKIHFQLCSTLFSTTIFFLDRFNPPLLHRVSQWLKRDLASLVATEQMWTPTLAFIIRCMIKYDITSDEFISNIARAMPDHYEHFVHELINFAKSPSEMSQYDRDVGYLPKLDNPRKFSVA